MFKRNVTAAGVSFTKKPHKFLSFKNYICQASTAEFFSQEVSRARAEYAAADEALNAAAARRTDLVANIAEAVAPVSSTVSALVAAESSAAALAPQNVAATREQAECADLGLSAVASALSGAITASTGRPSGITSDDAPAAALATLSGRQQAAERVGAKRLRDAAIGLSAPSGSDRLYVMSGRIQWASATPSCMFLDFACNDLRLTVLVEVSFDCCFYCFLIVVMIVSVARFEATGTSDGLVMPRGLSLFCLPGRDLHGVCGCRRARRPWIWQSSSFKMRRVSSGRLFLGLSRTLPTSTAFADPRWVGLRTLTQLQSSCYRV